MSKCVRTVDIATYAIACREVKLASLQATRRNEGAKARPSDATGARRASAR